MTEQTMRYLVVEALKEENSVFDRYDDSKDNTLVLYYEGDNLSEIGIYISFRTMDSGAYLVSMGCYDLPNFSKHYQAGIQACNKLNDDEMMKYYIDSDGDAVTNMALMFNAYGVSNDFSPKQVISFAVMMALSVDDAYPVLERAKWAN